MAKQALRYLALLRGINVGGKNIIAKEALRQCFEDLDFSCVRTYIPSGNILFRSGASATTLTKHIEDGLTDRFSYKARAVVLSHRRYRAALESAPDGWGHEYTVQTQRLLHPHGHDTREDTISVFKLLELFDAI